MNSIRTYLIAAILAVITLFNFVAALRGYQSSLVEADLLFDTHLLNTARIIANISPQPGTPIVDPGGTIVFQVWQEGKLKVSSPNAPVEIIGPLAPGFDYSNFNNYRWRTVAYYQPQKRKWILVAERTDLRFTLAETVVLESILPILAGLPLVGLLIWFIVSQGLKPLRVLADELSSRQPDDLSPLSIANPRQELGKIVASSNALLARLETSLLRERQFASDAAHELRTPISALKVQLFNLRDDLPQNSRRENSNLVELTATAERLENIVEQILDLYRNSPDQYHAAFTQIDLAKLIQQVMADAVQMFDKKDQLLEFTGEPHFILGDEFALTTLLQNLLSNASKYTPKGGQILVSLCASSDAAIITVEDSGPGIAPELRQTVFERFYRVGGDRHASWTPGCGLGLAIVKGIADLHQASIEITDSRFEHGAAFKVSFPRNLVHHLDASQKPTLPTIDR